MGQNQSVIILANRNAILKSVTASKESPSNGSSSAEPCTNSTSLWRLRPSSSMPWLMSSAVTSAPAFAMGAEDAPVPVLTALQPMVAKGKRPILLTHAEIRRYVKKLVETDLPSVAVLSYDELPSDLTIHPMGRATISSLS